MASPAATVLILGSMPGAVSLAQQQYYAHPRNLFWPIMAQLCQCDASASYTEKLQQLTDSGIALWDVIDSCQRQGSLDSAIRDEQVNDFAAFLVQHRNIRAIGFNGAKAWHSFKRYVLPTQPIPAHIALLQLPSTSPAHAAMTFEQKLQQWRQLTGYLNA
ncbi:MAG TPA: DNA-deoxyinosine glycosylase [Rheinheimera sp.]|nr:DNA-deoxyinosine glycosylase [Rheinheimera sp.]